MFSLIRGPRQVFQIGTKKGRTSAPGAPMGVHQRDSWRFNYMLKLNMEPEGDRFWKVSFSGSMLNSRGVCLLDSFSQLEQ